jgi:hypothetical protein
VGCDADLYATTRVSDREALPWWGVRRQPSCSVVLVRVPARRCRSACEPRARRADTAPAADGNLQIACTHEAREPNVSV